MYKTRDQRLQGSRRRYRNGMLMERSRSVRVRKWVMAKVTGWLRFVYDKMK